MIYIKSYCYSKHELPFIIAQLQESYDYIEKYYLAEFNRTHTGLEKEYVMESELEKIPSCLRDKLEYIKYDVSDICDNFYNNENMIHAINEPIQRNMILNKIPFKDDDIIIDVDCDEIIYKSSYPEIIKVSNPRSLKMHLMFFKENWLWKDKTFRSASVYRFGNLQLRNIIKNIKIYNTRDISNDLDNNFNGVHMSWIMSLDDMVKKLHSYSHPMYRKYADKEVLRDAIENKKYIFNESIKFDIKELDWNDKRIPEYFRIKNENE